MELPTLTKPRLRPIDFQPVQHQGQWAWLLRDPLQLSPYQLIVPAHLAQLLVFCDGSRTLTQIQQALQQQYGLNLPYSIISETLSQCDTAFLLDNEQSQKACQQRLKDYRAQPYRPPALANLSYPANPQALSHLFAQYKTANGSNPPFANGDWRGRGIISPHIDYERGGKVYAKVWECAGTAAQQADLILIFGTDHNSGNLITLTQQAYATPYGILPTDLPLVNRLAEAFGKEAAFAYELHHSQEHSIELSAVWLHHALAGCPPCPMIPILVGSFYPYYRNGGHPGQDERFNRFLDCLQRESAGKNVLAVASVDLAHVGPNFGDPFPMTHERRKSLTTSDKSLLQAIRTGDAERFYREIAGIQDQNRICGFSSIYLLLRYLEVTQGIEIAYEHCPADAEDNSLVSICGILLN